MENKTCAHCGQNNPSDAARCKRCDENLFVGSTVDNDAMDRILKKVNSLNRLYSNGSNASSKTDAASGEILLKERIELNTKSGRYIKCNNCNRLSPDQKFCMYCFSELDQNAAFDGGAGATSGDADSGQTQEQPVRHIMQPIVLQPAIKSYKDARGVSNNFSATKRARESNGLSNSLKDYSKAREKIDAAFTVSAINYEALGLSEEQYNLKFLPPKASKKFDFSASEKFNAAYKKYEKPTTVAAKVEDTPVAAKKSVADVAPSVAKPDATEKAAADAVAFDGAAATDEVESRQNIYTIKRQSERFKLTLLGVIGLLAASGVISSLFLDIFGAGNSGLNIVALMPKVLGLEITNGFISLAEGSAAMIAVSALYLLVLTLNVYMISAYVIRLALDKKIKTYGTFISSFVCFLSNILILFGLMIGGVVLGDFKIGFNVLFTASIINFICSIARLVSDR